MRVFILFFKNSFLCHFHHCCSPGSSDCCGKRLVFHIFLRRWAAIFFFPSLCWILYSSDRMEAAACTVVSPTFCPLLDNNYRGVSSHDRSSSPFFSSLCWVFSIYFQALLIRLWFFFFLWFKQFSVRSYTWFRHAPHIRHYKLIRLDVLRRNEISEYARSSERDARKWGDGRRWERGRSGHSSNSAVTTVNTFNRSA
jgi:hypothetical protein